MSDLMCEAAQVFGGPWFYLRDANLDFFKVHMSTYALCLVFCCDRVLLSLINRFFSLAVDLILRTIILKNLC